MGLWYRAKSPRRDQGQRRVNGRKAMNQPALLKAIEDGSALGQCAILDVSEGGARLRVTRPADIPDSFILALSQNAKAFRRCQVRWRSETELGVQFHR